MTDSVKGQSLGEVETLFRDFQSMVTAAPDSDLESDALGKLAVFAGVREFPSRVKCASLAWHALRAALKDSGPGGGPGSSPGSSVVTTESAND